MLKLLQKSRSSMRSFKSIFLKIWSYLYLGTLIMSGYGYAKILAGYAKILFREIFSVKYEYAYQSIFI